MAKKKKTIDYLGKTQEELVDLAIKQIISDYEMGDTTAVAELLMRCKTVDLINYLPEEK